MLRPRLFLQAGAAWAKLQQGRLNPLCAAPSAGTAGGIAIHAVGTDPPHPHPHQPCGIEPAKARGHLYSAQRIPWASWRLNNLGNIIFMAWGQAQLWPLNPGAEPEVGGRLRGKFSAGPVEGPATGSHVRHRRLGTIRAAPDTQGPPGWG
ncbi:hypothetical protein NDU88_005802 [Pleurodeles waltl]|uniref:Uncharacterized protein n=1 Tax=Pleurodeles waltl TaxID=8319 RepID=A0AAV7L1Y2_PLEWA|nr:hypothetical protein NDU88_005802 [Pleurodeles waltl]